MTSNNQTRIKVLLSKIGLDGHDWGVLVVLKALRDAGMEVVYLGRHRTVEQIVASAVQEDVDVVGLSSLTDSHRTVAPRIVRGLRDNGLDVPVVLGGFIQPEDFEFLKERGIAEVFPTGSRMDTIVARVRELAGG
ncbi:MAG: cobalamin B12-binding domain-containing protein [Chloroflexi bacterium]|nr:cobalamin B12-binding domain-containing protein [Chloroflexota bacterium]